MRTLIATPQAAFWLRAARSLQSRRRRPTRRAWLPSTVVVGLALTGCAATAQPTTSHDHATDLDHVHAIVADPGGDGFLLGAHDGIYPATRDAEVGEKLATTDFDAMGLTVVDDVLIASGHPGPNTPSELGSPHLGIIRSDDGARSWSPVTFTSEKDFHVLTATPEGTLYGIATDSIELLRSDDRGQAWTPVGDGILAFSLVTDASNRLLASTPDGVQISSDGGRTFAPLDGAPALYLLAASPDGQNLVGVGAGEQIWTSTASSKDWQQVAITHGPAQAVAITDDAAVLVFDDSGLSLIPRS